MNLAVVTSSAAFERHLAAALPARLPPRRFAAVDDLLSQPLPAPTVVIVHAASLGASLPETVRALASRPGLIVAVASDEPSVQELLSLAHAGIRGYCNSFMADVHYQHLLHTLEDGQNWFAPQLLGEVVRLVQTLQGDTAAPDVLDLLTDREKEIALGVCEGLSNKELADRFAITERTVKAHLTSIYQKTGIPDRLALASHLLRRPQAAAIH